MKNRIIYLAGGNSSRFKDNKLLYKYKGLPIYQYCLKNLIQLIQSNHNYSLYIITQYKEIENYIQILNIERVNVIYNEECQKGISYTIKTAINALPKENAYDTFIVSDQPFIKYQTLNEFMKQTIDSKKLVGCITYQNEYYNPTMFHSSLEKELLTLREDQGGKRILKQHLDSIYCYKINDILEIKDIDYKSDLNEKQ